MYAQWTFIYTGYCMQMIILFKHERQQINKKTEDFRILVIDSPTLDWCGWKYAFVLWTSKIGVNAQYTKKM